MHVDEANDAEEQHVDEEEEEEEEPGEEEAVSLHVYTCLRECMYAYVGFRRVSHDLLLSRDTLRV
jgi:hypothetical protein